ncbi:MAG: helix-turn-helix transcriptional regulator [Acidimicrobiaceae bacterium]|nr:helix-turn-helix transcriptional regulator [Acidimicrobiaceae bacterium]
MIHYDRLAALTTLDGARRLERAAMAVQRHIGQPSPARLDDGQRKLLNKLADGAPIVDMAADLGYSERTIYRALDRLYRMLGVTDRLQAVRKAATEGLLDS